MNEEKTHCPQSSNRIRVAKSAGLRNGRTHLWTQRKRAYEKIEKTDGFRILVDKLWPRGLKKEDAKIDYWAKIITPSKELRQNYHKGIIDFENFSEKYRKELEENSDFKEFEGIILEELKKGNVTMVYASRTPELSHIPVLKEFIEEKFGK